MELALFGLPILAAVIFGAAFLSGRSDEQGANSPARWQLLFMSVAGALSYLGTVLTTDTGGALPELPGLVHISSGPRATPSISSERVAG
jgi:hypothetical protein